jgi:hypothetical protein
VQCSHEEQPAKSFLSRDGFLFVPIDYNKEVIPRSIKVIVIALSLALQIASLSGQNAVAANYTFSNSTMTNYYVTATAGQSFTAYTQKTGGDPYLTLFAPNGTVATFNDDGYGNLDSYINNYTFPSSGVYRLNAGQCCTADGAWTGSTYTIYITTGATVSTTNVDNTSPTISAISINANAGADGTYIAGDVITATITWSENVNITGSPRIPIQGLSSKYFNYSTGSGTTSTAFTYTVVNGDNDSDGIAVSSNTFELNSGTIKDAANNVATLTHSAVTASTSQKVDTTVPTFSSAATNTSGTQIIMTFSEALSATTAATSSFTATLAGSNMTVSTATVSGSTIVLSVSPTIKVGQSVTIAYTDPSGSNDANAVQDIGGNDAATVSSTSVSNLSTVKQNQASVTLTGGSSTFGTPFRLSGSGGSGTGSFSYLVVSGPCAITNSDSLTATATGTCSVTATKATDSTYLAETSTAASVNFTIGQSTATITITPGSLMFRQQKDISATGSTAGSITFKVNDTFIPGCRNLKANSGNSYTVTCPYKPSVRGSVIFTVSLTPSSPYFTGTVSTSEKFFIYNRTGKR